MGFEGIAFRLLFLYPFYHILMLCVYRINYEGALGFISMPPHIMLQAQTINNIVTVVSFFVLQFYSKNLLAYLYS